MSTFPMFRVDAEGRWVLARLLLGFAAAVLSLRNGIPAAGLMLVLCVWMDAATGRIFRRRGPKSPGTSALETHADAFCFIVAPMGFAAALATAPWPRFLLPVFLLAAVYRMARFQVQGLVRGGYAGLPVTYNGYLFPLAGLAAHAFPPWANGILAVLLLAVSGLMVSKRFVVPEF